MTASSGTNGLAADTTYRGDHPTEPAAAEPDRIPRLPVPARLARFLVLLAVFICAACGLVYELALIALGSYLFGNSVIQASIVLSVMVFAMGVGSLAAKRLQRRPAESFAAVEGLLALLGGLSVLGLYACFAWIGMYRPALVVISFVVGSLIGAEIPLLMTLLQRIRRQDAGSAVADMFAVDYVGALVGGLAFPFLLLPLLGQIKGALVTGGLNAVAGVAVVLWVFRTQVRRRLRVALWAAMAAVLAVLGGAYALSGPFEITARQALYADPIVYAERTSYQQIVFTRSRSLAGGTDLRLFLNGDLQFSSVDEYRYHEALVHPAMAGRHRSVLVLGGGDGLAMREVLRYPGVRRAVEVELDPAMIRLARTYGPLTSLNRDALDDPRVEVVTTDAFSWLRNNTERFDVVIVDLPDPDDVPTAKLYSVEFYSLARHALAPGGRMVVQAGSPYFAPKSFWCIEASIRAAGLRTVPYRINVPSFGPWGFVLASAEETPKLRLDDEAPPLRFVDNDLLRSATVFAEDRDRVDVPPNTLTHPRILEYERREWQHY